MITGQQIIMYLVLKHNGDWNKIFDSVKKKEIVDEKEAEEAISKVKCKYVTLVDKEYPECFKHIYCPPFAIFYYGNLDLLSNYTKNISVVGSRENSDYGRMATEKLVKELVPDYTIVSGMAKGIDRIAHDTAIKNGGKTIAVLGSGIDYCYPKSNFDLYSLIKRDHLIISEYPGMTEPIKDNFPFRNRLIAALSKAVLVTEAKQRSGTLTTVSFALRMGKDVLCVPYSMFENSMCNALIKEGAAMVESRKDIEDNIK